MAEKEGDGKESGLDERMAWLMNRACTSLKIKQDKFRKMIGADESWYAFEINIAAFLIANRQMLLQFFEVAHIRHLTLYLDAKEDLMCTLGYPPALKKKSIVFLKKQEVGGMTAEMLNAVWNLPFS